MTALAAADVIALLELKPHPEGGHFRETFRDERSDGGRAASTAIYFLLALGEVSRWHRVDAAEVGTGTQARPWSSRWRHPQAAQTGAPRAGSCGGGGRAVVPAGHGGAKSLGGWTLVGCTVAPGFAFEGFEMAADDFEPPAPAQGSRSDVA
jgi:predicted cupin superfamily sugar epimerase